MTELLERLTGVTFLSPAFLLLAPAVLVAAWIAHRRRTGAAFAPAPLLGDPAPLPATWRTRLAWLPTALQALGLLAVVVALARPVRRERLAVETEGIDVVLAVDVSSSMLAEDLEPGRSRLDVAKDAASRFVQGRPHDRIGLVQFARWPDLRCPPTLDHDALRKILAGAATVRSDGPEDATGIGTAVARAAQVLSASRAASKVVVLLTDGAENVATERTPDEISPVHAAQLCRELGVRVHVITAGEPGGAAPPAARRLAERTGGRAFEARDAAAVSGVYNAIDALERSAAPDPRWRVEERYLVALGAAAALVAAAAALRSTALDVLP